MWVIQLSDSIPFHFLTMISSPRFVLQTSAYVGCHLSRNMLNFQIKIFSTLISSNFMKFNENVFQVGFYPTFGREIEFL